MNWMHELKPDSLGNSGEVVRRRSWAKTMIERRPERLSEYSKYTAVPVRPFPVSWDWVPELIRASFLPLHGILPVTAAMLEAAGGRLGTAPTDGEIEYFGKRGTHFQLIHLVLSLAWWREDERGLSAVPYAISVIPASKRGKVSEVDIDYIAALRGAPVDPSIEHVYGGFDPFKGDWSIVSLGGDYIAQQGGKGRLDEIGIVLERYFLATDYGQDAVLEVDGFLPDERSKRAYLANRIKKLYTPFKEVTARRIWGVETPIELFVYQELLFRNIRPECQYLVYPGGECFPSLYDVFADVEFRHGAHILTEADFYFPEARVAVFCDGGHHLRAKQVAIDARIVAQLNELGIRSVRLPGELIRRDLEAAGEKVAELL